MAASTAVAERNGNQVADVIESVVNGDLSKLAPAGRVDYYRQVCASLHLNPLTKPFDYITLNGKLTLYARKDCTDQLRRRDEISIEITSREAIDDVYIVTARATDKSGRTDESIGAVAIAGLKGDAKANAIMKSESKAKRRVTLSICGLGMMDETEIETVPAARQIEVDHDTGDIEAVPEPKHVPKKERTFEEWKAKLPTAPDLEALQKSRPIYRSRRDFSAAQIEELDILAATREGVILSPAKEEQPPEEVQEESTSPLVEMTLETIRNATEQQIGTMKSWVDDFSANARLEELDERPHVHAIQAAWFCRAFTLAPSRTVFTSIVGQSAKVKLPEELQAEVQERMDEAKERLKIK